MRITPLLKQQLSHLPSLSGCYVMRNIDQKIIYVGKAKNLKKRVNSYFIGKHENKTERLIQEVNSFDTIVTGNEIESLLLEESLIKSYHPKYNIALMDDKTYPYLRISKRGYPVLACIRGRQRKSEYSYYGPYPNAGHVRRFIKLIESSMWDGHHLIPNGLGTYYRLNQGSIQSLPVDEQQLRDEIIEIIQDAQKVYRKLLKTQMDNYAQQLSFELAKELKEDIHALDYIREPQTLAFSKKEHFDVIDYAMDEHYISFFKLSIRQGRVQDYGRITYPIDNQSKEEVKHALQSTGWMQSDEARLIYLPESLHVLISDELSSKDMKVPQIGKKKTLQNLVLKNAQKQLKEDSKLASLELWTPS